VYGEACKERADECADCLAVIVFVIEKRLTRTSVRVAVWEWILN
jgi:hypothetical protein